MKEMWQEQQDALEPWALQEEIEFLKTQLKNTEGALCRAEKALKHKAYLEKCVLSGDGFTCQECEEVFHDMERSKDFWDAYGEDWCEDCAEDKEMTMDFEEKAFLTLVRDGI